MAMKRAGYNRAGWQLFVLLLLTLLSLRIVLAEQTSPSILQTPASTVLKAKEIEALINTLELSSDQSAAASSNLEDYKQSLDLLRNADADNEIARGFQQLVDNGVAEIRSAQNELERTLSRIVKVPASKADLLSLEQQLDRELAEHRALNKALSKLESTQVAQRLRPDQLLSELAKAKIELGKLDIARQSRVDEVVAGRSEGQRSLIQAQGRALEARINRLELERLSYRSRMDLLDLQIRETQAKFENSERFLEALRHRINQLRSAEAEKERQATEQVQVESSGKHPLIQQEADRNSELGLELERLVRDIEQAQQERSRVVSQLDRVKYNLDRFQQRLGIIDLDRAQSDLLRTQRRELPDLRKLKRDLDKRQQKALKTRIDAFKLEDQRQAISARLAYTELERLRPVDVSDNEWRSIRAELRSLFRHQSALLAKLRDALDRYERVVGDINLEQQQLIDTADGYGELLDRHLAWMPSTRSFDFTSIFRIAEQLFALLSLENRQDLLDRFATGLMAEVAVVTLLLLFAFLLVSSSPRMRRQLAHIAPKVGKVAQDDYWLTPVTMLITLLLALPVPLVLMLVAVIVDSASEMSINQGAAQGILRAAELLLLLQLLRYLFIPNGLSQGHFHWSEQVVVIIRQQLRWFTPLFITLALVVTIAEWQSEEIYRNTLGRAAFLLGMGVLLLFMHRLFRLNCGVFSQWQPPLALWWRRSAYLLVVGGVLALMLLAFEGYYYVAYRLARLAVISTMAGVGIFLLYSLAMRLLQVASRRFSLEQARARRRATQDARAAREAAEAAGEGLPEVDLDEINLATVNEQTRSLLRVLSMVLFAAATVMIWRELMPAVERLDDVVLWQYLVTGSEGEQITAFSLLDLGLGLMTLVITIAAAKNLPALLEITLLAPLALDKGNRYAMVSITRYLIYSAGALLIFGLVGLEWSDIQWLVAAMGVGIGFGLKEIFANLISGIIILFERPIRIGDTVTLGDVSGTVTRIRIRATTITDWNNKELIVPNQSFIIDPLINWTLSDQVTRIVLPVGIAYGSDTLLAHQLMSDVVNNHPDVMQDPKPTVFFIGFGESSLDFEIRVFVRERVMRMPVQHELYMTLERALRDADIEIPFPQRDLHLRSLDPGVNLGSNR